jgi:hypothetical protein
MSARIYDLYGSRSLTLDDLREAVQTATGLDLERRDSQQLGGEYFRGGSVGGEELVAHRNWDEEGEAIEEAFEDYSVLFRVERSLRADELRVLLNDVQGLDFLRRTRG